MLRKPTLDSDIAAYVEFGRLWWLSSTRLVVVPRECSCAGVLDEVEWKLLWVSEKRSRPPRQAPSLRWTYEAIAKLGGWLDTKGTGRASWEVMWHGWFPLQERVDAYLAARKFLNHE